MSRRHKAKGAIAGLRSIQALGSLAVPGTLEQVPEEIEIKSTKNEIFASDDWKSVQKAVRDIFNEEFKLGFNGELYRLHQNVRNILESKTGTFFCDCYKEWVSKEMLSMAEKLRDLKDTQLLQKYEEIWSNFFQNTLPLLDAVLYLVKPNGRMSIRSTTLAVFRDVVLLSADLEGAIRSTKEVSSGIKQMLLISAWVNDSYPPNKNKIRTEYLAAQVTSRFLGYLGLYENGELVVASNEPMLAAKRRPSADVGGPRRISRPFSVQPHHMDTLNQLFKNAVRQKTIKEHR